MFLAAEELEPTQQDAAGHGLAPVASDRLELMVAQHRKDQIDLCRVMPGEAGDALLRELGRKRLGQRPGELVARRPAQPSVGAVEQPQP